MRFLEIILVGLISIQIAILLLDLLKSKRSIMFYLALCIFVLLLHLIFEGYRWQMIPAYLTFITLLVVQLRDKKLGKGLKILRGALFTFLLILSVFLPSALPVLHFKTSGTYKVGIKNHQLLDTNREEILTKKINDNREISIRVFYPTPSTEKKQYPYIPNFEKIRFTYQKKLGWPPFLLNYLKLLTIEVNENAPLFSDKKFPIIFYSHGMTNNYNEASGRLLKIASKGYVVVAINHTYSSDFGILKNKSIVRYKPQSFLGDSITKIDSVKTIIANQWIDDIKFTNFFLQSDNLSKTIDFKKIGLMGFSAGGTMATLGSYKIKNVKAAINLDGTPRGIDINQSPSCPIMFLYSEPQQFSDTQIKYWGITREQIKAPKLLIKKRTENILSKAPEGSYTETILKTKHSNFIEYPLISPLSSYLEIGGEIDSWECYDLINTKISTFFSTYLK